MGIAINLAEKGYLPDFTIRAGIRGLLRQRLAEIQGNQDVDPNVAFAKRLSQAAIAEDTDKANEQHYEVPAAFFQMVLGKHLKYSSCFYENGAKSLDEAEAHMLALYQERAKIENGQRILDMGCGWGSFSLWAAEHCPESQITGVSNSRSQREFIMAEAQKRGLNNVQIITADMNDFKAPEQYDRIVSIEMFEHMRNYEQLFGKVATWLKDDGLAFVHVFAHKQFPYFFETEGDDNWMGRYFFTGGIMPSHDLYRQYDHILRVDKTWRVNGMNYGQTSLDWLANMDRHRDAILKLFAETYGKQDANRWFQRWRIFFMSCAELFSFQNGNEWDVMHYRFVKS